MLITTIILFALAAVLGLVLITKVFKDEALQRQWFTAMGRRLPSAWSC